MITLAHPLIKKRKWPYRGWHKRFFLLENGYMMYGRSEQDVNIICTHQNKNVKVFLFFNSDKTWSNEW